MRLLSVLREPVIALAVLGFAIAAPAALAADAPAPKSTAPAAPGAAPATGANEIVARVGDTNITRGEWEDASRRMFEMYKRMAASGQAPQGADIGKEPTDDQKRKVLDSLLSAKTLEALVKKSDVKVSDAEVDDRLKLIMDTQGIKSPEEFAKFGITMDQVKSQVKDELARQKYIENLTKDVTPTDAEIEALFNKMKADNQMELKEDAVDVATILIRASGPDEAIWTAARKKIDGIRERVAKNKEDFLKVAKETSQDPEVKRNGAIYPLVTQKSGPFGAEYTAAAFALPDGEVSNPVRVKAGWCLLKVVKKRAPGPLSLANDDGVKQFISGRVYAQKSKELLDKTVADGRAAMKAEILLPAAAASATPPATPAAPDEKKKDGAPNSLLIPGST